MGRCQPAQNDRLAGLGKPGEMLRSGDQSPPNGKRETSKPPTFNGGGFLIWGWEYKISPTYYPYRREGWDKRLKPAEIIRRRFDRPLRWDSARVNLLTSPNLSPGKTMRTRHGTLIPNATDYYGHPAE